jgi:ATP-binding cassette subfamily B protein
MEMVAGVCIDLGWSLMAGAASLIAMFAVNFKLALITVAAVPLIALLSVYFQKKILKYQREARRINSMITSSINEGKWARNSKTHVCEVLNCLDFTGITKECNPNPCLG